MPYLHSEECERRVNAQKGLPTHVQEGEAYVKSWEELQDRLHDLLRDCNDSRGSEFYSVTDALEVSKLKLMFRTRLKVELSETVFGHECLSGLLQDPRLGEDFALEITQGNPGNQYVLKFKGAGKQKGTRKGNVAAPYVSPPPGLSDPEADDIPPPPGLSPVDREGWPTPSLEKEPETSVDGQQIHHWGSRQVGVENREPYKHSQTYQKSLPRALREPSEWSAQPPLGLTPEKTVKKVPSSGSGPPGLSPSSMASSSNNKTKTPAAKRIWTRI